MSFEHSESETRVPRSRINLQDRCSSSIMDVRARKITTDNPLAPPPNTRVEKRKMEYNRSLSQGSSRRLLTASHFSLGDAAIVAINQLLSGIPALLVCLLLFILRSRQCW